MIAKLDDWFESGAICRTARWTDWCGIKTAGIQFCDKTKHVEGKPARRISTQAIASLPLSNEVDESGSKQTSGLLRSMQASQKPRVTRGFAR